MYDKKNFFPHTHKKIPLKNRPPWECPTNKKKEKKRAENHTLKQLVKEREKKTKSKIKSQDYETFF